MSVSLIGRDRLMLVDKLDPALVLFTLAKMLLGKLKAELECSNS